MDDMERFATTALLLLVIVRLVKEVKGVLEPLPRWPAGADPASIVARKGKDGSDSTDWLTPEEEFERWAKGGARPGRKRLLVSVSQAVLALLAVPVWWRTTAIVRAPVPVRAIATETATPPLAFAAPVVHVTLPRDESPSLVSAVLKGAARCTAADVRVTAHPGIHADWLRELAGSSDLDVDQWANSRGDDDDEYDYRLMFLPSEDDEYVGPGTTLVMGTGRAAWARLRAGADDATTTAAADAVGVPRRRVLRPRPVRTRSRCIAFESRRLHRPPLAAHPGRQGAPLVHAGERVAGSRTRARVQLAVRPRRRAPVPCTRVVRAETTGPVRCRGAGAVPRQERGGTTAMGRGPERVRDASA